MNLIHLSANSKISFNPKDEVDDDLFKPLLEDGYVRDGFAQYYLTRKGVDFFDSGDENFKEFFELFPQRVPNGQGGERTLRAVSINSKNANDAFRKWRSTTLNNEDKEKHIIACLAAEIVHRKRSNSLTYMNNILTWLHQKKWEMYEHLIDIPKTDSLNKEKSI